MGTRWGIYLLLAATARPADQPAHALPAPPTRQWVEQLGFKLTDIKIILSSHAHIDHTGGHALMKQLTGAQVMASAGDARVLESGGADDFLPFPRDTILYAPVKTPLALCSGNHDLHYLSGQERAQWIRGLRRKNVWMDGDAFWFRDYRFRCIGWCDPVPLCTTDDFWLMQG